MSYSAMFSFDKKLIRWKSDHNAQVKNGKVLVIVHGVTQRIELFDEVVHNLEDSYETIYRFDLRGHGLSYRPVKKYTHVENFEHYKKDLGAFLKNIVYRDNPDKEIHILSHSMGSAITAWFLGTEDHKIKKAIIASPALSIRMAPLSPLGLKTLVKYRVHGPKLPTYWLSTVMTKLGLGKLTPVNKFTFSQYSKWDVPFKKAYGHNAEDTTDEIEYERSRKILREAKELPTYKTPTFGWAYEYIKNEINIQEGFSDIHIPCLVIVPANDFFCNENVTLELASKNKNMECMYLPKSKHFALEERHEIRDVVFEKIKQFINK